MEKYHVEDTELLVNASKDACFQVNAKDLEVIKLLYQQTTMLFALMDQQKPPGVQIVNTYPLIIVGIIVDHRLDAIDEDIIVILENNYDKIVYWIYSKIFLKSH